MDEITQGGAKLAGAEAASTFAGAAELSSMAASAALAAPFTQAQAAQDRGTVIFDLDGTLIDTSRDMIGAANLWFKAMGAPAPLDPELDGPVGLIGGRVMLRLGLRRLGRVLPQTGQPDERLIDRGYHEFAALYAQNICVQSKPYPGAVAAITALRQAGYRTGICTNKPVALSEMLLKQLGVWDLFDSHIGAGSLPQRKPDPEPLLAAIAQAGGDPSRSVLIGDTDTDLNAARAAGVKIALVTFGPSGQAVDQMGADALLQGYEALGDLVAQLF